MFCAIRLLCSLENLGSSRKASDNSALQSPVAKAGNPRFDTVNALSLQDFVPASGLLFYHYRYFNIKAVNLSSRDVDRAFYASNRQRHSVTMSLGYKEFYPNDN